MPSPLGHALGGLAAGWIVAGRPVGDGARTDRSAPAPASRVASWWGAVRRHPSVRSAAWFGLLGMLPDIDFLFGSHSTYTHSVGAVVGIGLLALAAGGRRHWRLALASALAYGTHVLFDWLGNDTSPPIGIMALWPVSDAFYQSEARLFEAISRRYWLPGFLAHNARAMAWELAVLLPLAALAGWLRVRPAWARPDRATPPPAGAWQSPPR